jgi:hypothetical protein
MGTRPWKMRYVPPLSITTQIFMRSSEDKKGTVSTETQPLDSPQNMATAKNTSAPLAAPVARDNVLENGLVSDCKTIADGTERNRIQCHHQIDQSQGVQFQRENPLFNQELDAIPKKGRELVSTRPDSDDEKMGLAASLSLNPIRTPRKGSGINGASLTDEELNWEWINHPNDHIDHRRSNPLYWRQQEPLEDPQRKLAPTPPRVSERNTEGVSFPSHSGLQHCG